MENTTPEEINFKMETNGNINTESTTPEEIKQVNKTRGRPKRTEQETTQEGTNPKKTREQKTTNFKLDDEERQLLNIQSKLNNLKEAEETTKRHYRSLKKQSKTRQDIKEI